MALPFVEIRFACHEQIRFGIDKPTEFHVCTMHIYKDSSYTSIMSISCHVKGHMH